MSCTAPSFSLQRPDSRDANQLNDPVIVVCFRYPSSDTINLLQYVLFVTGVDGGGGGGVSHSTQASLAIHNVHGPPLYSRRAPSPPPSFLLASLCLHCFTLLLGLQVIGNGTDPS